MCCQLARLLALTKSVGSHPRRRQRILPITSSRSTIHLRLVARQLFRQAGHMPHLYLENNHVRSIASADLMWHLTQELGYRCWYHVFPYDRGPTLSYFTSPPDEVFKNMASSNVLCLDARFDVTLEPFSELLERHWLVPHTDVWSDRVCDPSIGRSFDRQPGRTSIETCLNLSTPV